MSVEEQLLRAIPARYLLSARYQGHLRLLAPRALGHTAEGALMLLSVQVGGASGTGLTAPPQENWRCMRVARLEDLQVLATSFVSSERYDRRQTCIATLLADVHGALPF